MGPQDDSLVVLARIGRPHGIRGEVCLDRVGQHLRKFVEKEVAICRAPVYQPVLPAATQVKTTRIVSLSPKTGPAARALFAGVESREVAQELTQSFIAAPLGTLREMAQKERGEGGVALEALWYFEMIGLRVVDAETLEPFARISAVDDWEKNTIVTLEPLPGENVLQSPLEIPLLYPHWGMADLYKREITLAEWRIFV